jgi:hypothetical protein
VARSSRVDPAERSSTRISSIRVTRSEALKRNYPAIATKCGSRRANSSTDIALYGYTHCAADAGFDLDAYAAVRAGPMQNSGSGSLLSRLSPSYLPRWLGWLLAADGFAWVVNELSDHLLPSAPLGFLSGFFAVELIFMVWPLGWGWRIEEPRLA